jgi:hypothetical protein
MATFILKWNPAISSFTSEDFALFRKQLPRNRDLNWSVWDYEKVKKGDEFYMLKVGEGANGIVMKGRFSSDAWMGDDWSGKGRETYYCWLSIDYFVDDENEPMLTSEQLEEMIPDFDWRKGHSGLKLLKEQSSVLEKYFENYLAENPDFVQKMKDDKARSLDKKVINSIDSIPGGELWQEVTDWLEDEKERYTWKATDGCANISISIDYIKSELRLAVYFKGGKVLHILCKGLRRVIADLDNCGDSYDMFRINYENDDDDSAFDVDINDLSVVCREVIFEKVTPFEGDKVPLSL